MANKTIHELTPASTITSDYEFAVYDTDSDSTKKATASQILDTEDLLYADDEDEPSEEVDFTSQDTSLSPSESVSVDLLSGNDSWSQRFVKISQMFKNIRYLLGKIGSSIMGTTATTLTGAIAEHESDINTLNKKTAYSIETITIPVTYASTTNPFNSGTVSVQKSGKKAISIGGWYFNGENSSLAFVNALHFNDYVNDTIYYSIRVSAQGSYSHTFYVKIIYVDS